jgi:hypothetical protein
MAHGEFIRDNDPQFTFGEIVANFFVYLSIHQMTFKAVVRSTHAKWADHVIDFQVGFSAFMFYISFACNERSNLLDSIIAGSITSVSAIAAGAGVILVRWISQIQNEGKYNEVE